MKLTAPAIRTEMAMPVHQQIARCLERQIFDGALPARSRLPPASELAEGWGVPYLTLQRAMTQLTSAGLIERKPGRGTFVRAREQKTVIGLLFGPSLVEETGYSCRAVLRALRERIEQSGTDSGSVGELSEPTRKCNWTARVYDDFHALSLKDDLQQHSAYRHLAEDIQNREFKGWIAIDTSLKLFQKFHQIRDLPSVLFSGPLNQPDFTFDLYAFGYDVFSFLARQRRRRIVYLRNFCDRPGCTADRDGIRAVMREYGLPMPEIRQLSYEVGGETTEREAFACLGRLIDRWRKAGKWPDAIVVSDDVAMRGSAYALEACPDAVPPQLHLATLANEGVDLRYGRPVIRYEVSARQIASQLIDLLWRRMNRATEPKKPILIPGRLVPANGVPAAVLNRIRGGP